MSTIWMRLPSRSTTESTVNASIGTGRTISHVMRLVAIGASEGVSATMWATSAAGAPPCIAPACHGPSVSGDERNRSSSMRLKSACVTPAMVGTSTLRVAERARLLQHRETVIPRRVEQANGLAVVEVFPALAYW